MPTGRRDAGEEGVMTPKKTITDKLEECLRKLRLTQQVSAEVYSLFRLCDLELLAILWGLDARIRRLEKGAGQL